MRSHCPIRLRFQYDGDRVSIRTPFCRAVVSRIGARLESLTVIPSGFEWCTPRGLAEEVEGSFPGQLSCSRFEWAVDEERLQATLSLTCHGQSDAVIDWGMTVRKTFTFFTDRPGIRVDLCLENIGSQKTLSSFRLHNEIRSHATSLFFTRTPRGFATLPFTPGNHYVRQFSSGLAGVIRPTDGGALLFVPEYDTVKEFYFFMSPALCTVEWFLKRIVIPDGHYWGTRYWIVPAPISDLREVDRVLRANGLAGHGSGTQSRPARVEAETREMADRDMAVGRPSSRFPGIGPEGEAAQSNMDDFARAAATLVSRQAVGGKGVIERNIKDAVGCWFSQALSAPLGAGFDLLLPDRPSLAVQARVTLRAGRHAAPAYLVCCDPDGQPYAVSSPARLDVWTLSQTLTLDVGRLRGKTVRLALVGSDVLWTDVRVVSDEGDTVMFDSLSAWTGDVAEMAGVTATSRRLTVFVRSITGTPTLECCCRDADGRLMKTSVRRTRSPEEPGCFAFEIPVGLAASIEYTARCGDRSVTSRAAIPPAARDAMDARALRLHVSPQGRDTWSGCRVEPNPAKTDGPFATLVAARDCIRKMKRRGLKRPVTVLVHAGAYLLDQTLVLTPEDSGTAACPITYLAEPGATVILSGGRRFVGPWQAQSDGTWICKAPGTAKKPWTFRSLRIAGVPAERSRWPHTGFLHLDQRGSDNQGRPVLHVLDAKLADGPRLDGAELMARYTWRSEMFYVTRTDMKENLLTLSRLPGRAISQCHIENVPDRMMPPGRWHVDSRAGHLVYRPREREDITKVDMVIPRLRELIRFQGDATKERSVRHITFQGFTLCDTAWPEQQEGGQAACLVGGAVVMEAAEHCVLRANRFQYMEGYAVELRSACRDNLIRDNEMNGMGAGGIRIGVTDKAGPVTAGNVVFGNHIHHCGRIYPGAVGLWVGQSGYNILARNHIHDLPYSGISVGWTWGRGDNPAQGNRIERNHIHHIMLELNDGGAIYTLGWSYGTTVCYNLIHDVPNGNGIYLDEGSSGIRVRGNMVYRQQVGLFLHGARENLVENNVVVESEKTHLIMSDCHSHMAANRLYRNIFARGRRPALFLHAYGWNNRFLAASDFNLLSGWTIRVPSIKGVDLAPNLIAWRRIGHDLHSWLGDPLFINPAKDDYRLKRRSPAWGLRFEPVDAAWAVKELQKSLRNPP